MRFAGADHRGVAAGEITVAFRRWARPRVVAGRVYRTAAGRLLVADVREVRPADVTDADPRAELAADDDLDAAALAALAARLDRLDRASSHGPWTRATLAAIAARPAVRASDLAASFGRETAPFKIDVRKLKNLGLTYSLAVGYELSPRGRAFLAAEGRNELT